MKTLALIALTATIATAYCERGSRIDMGYEGGHKYGLYDFGEGRFLKFTFPSGASIPYSIRYDFWKAEVCYSY